MKNRQKRTDPRIPRLRSSKRLTYLGFDIGTNKNHEQQRMSHKNRPKSKYDKEIYDEHLNRIPFGNEGLFCENNLIYGSSPHSPSIYLKKKRINRYSSKNTKLIKPKKFANKGFYIVYKNKNPYQPKNRHFKRFLHIVNDSKNYFLTRSRSMLNLRKLKSANNQIFEDNKKLRSRSFYMSRNRKDKNFLKRISKSPLKSDRNYNKNLQKIKTLIRSCSCNKRNNNLSIEFVDGKKDSTEQELKNKNKMATNNVNPSTTIKKTVAFNKEQSDNLILDTKKITTFKRIDLVEISNSEKTLRFKEGISNELTNVSSDVFLQKTIVSSKKTRQINTDNVKHSPDYQNTHYSSSYYIKSKPGFSFIETSTQEKSSSWGSSEQSLISREIIQSSVSKEKRVDSAVSNFEIRSRKVMMIPRQSRLELFNRSSENRCFILNKNFDTGSGKRLNFMNIRSVYLLIDKVSVIC
jgi:hypothetical protein